MLRRNFIKSAFAAGAAAVTVAKPVEAAPKPVPEALPAAPALPGQLLRVSNSSWNDLCELRLAYLGPIALPYIQATQAQHYGVHTECVAAWDAIYSPEFRYERIDLARTIYELQHCYQGATAGWWQRFDVCLLLERLRLAQSKKRNSCVGYNLHGMLPFGMEPLLCITQQPFRRELRCPISGVQFSLLVMYQDLLSTHFDLEWSQTLQQKTCSYVATCPLTGWRGEWEIIDRPQDYSAYLDSSIDLRRSSPEA